MMTGARLALLALALGAGSAGHAQEAETQTTTDAQAAAETEAVTASDAEAAPQEGLKVYFETGSSRVGPDQADTLDQAARLFREGNPFVMIVTGVADTVGPPGPNLSLSLRRAQAVADGLAARGIPIERLQVAGRGNSELEVDTEDGVSERDNRVAEITWR